MGKSNTRRRRQSRLRDSINCQTRNENIGNFNRLRERLAATLCCCFNSKTEEQDRQEEYAYGDGVGAMTTGPTATPSPTTVESGNGDSGTVPVPLEASLGARKIEDTRRVEEKPRMTPTEMGQGDRLTKIFAGRNKELPYGEDFYRRLHANNLVTAAIYQARQQVSMPVFEDLDQWSVSTPRSDLSRESWTISDCASTSKMSIYSSDATSILDLTSGSELSMESSEFTSSFGFTSGTELSMESTSSLDFTSGTELSMESTDVASSLDLTSDSESDVSLDLVRVAQNEKVETQNEELGGTEFYITLHTRNIVDSAIINAILEVELYG